jgi:hypothetical protein
MKDSTRKFLITLGVIILLLGGIYILPFSEEARNVIPALVKYVLNRCL